MKLETLQNHGINNNDGPPIAYILVGLPGSGKSTWIKNNVDSSFSIISTDNIIEKIAKQQNKTYSEVFNDNIKYATQQMNHDLDLAIKQGKNIVWDQTNLSAKKRASILNRIPKNYKKICVLFDVPLPVLYDRLYKRGNETGKYIPNKVIGDMLKTYQEPDLSEGFDDIIKIG